MSSRYTFVPAESAGALLRHTRKIVDAAEFFLAICNDCSDSVRTGHEASTENPARRTAAPRPSQASARLWVNITVITPSSVRTRRDSAKIAAIFDS